MADPGRGRGEQAKIPRLESPDVPGTSGGDAPTSRKSTSSSGSESGNNSGERSTRGRAAYRTEMSTIPRGVLEVRPTQPVSGALQVEVLSNFIKVTHMPKKFIYQYRVDFEPEIEARNIRRRLFMQAAQSKFPAAIFDFDCTFDARSAFVTPQETTEVTVDNPLAEGSVKITIKRVGSINDHPLELIRLYNINMKSILRKMGFFSVSTTGAYVHPDMAQRLDRFPDITILRGYRTSAVTAENSQILMNMEAVHKLAQTKNLLSVMSEIRANAQRRQMNTIEALRAALINKLVITNYNKMVYRIEDVNPDIKPTSNLPDNTQTYINFYRTKHNQQIREQNQPMIRVVHNNRRRQEQDQGEIYLVPELCNIAGLTEEQRNNFSLRNELIRVTQVNPADRVQKLNEFLQMLHGNQDIRRMLDNWNYDLGREPCRIKARILPTESITLGSRQGGPNKVTEKIDAQTANFDSPVLRERLVVPPNISKMCIIVPRNESGNQAQILTGIRGGFTKIGLNVGNVEVKNMPDDTAHCYTQFLRQIQDDTTITLVIMTNQNKPKYDAIKRLCSVERGLITQVVTSRLMMDQRKASGAAVKIGIQMAAKCGGEPWHIVLPLKSAMVCGYDTYHDTAARNCSYGAFVASLNDSFGNWFSKADRHDRLAELSGCLTENFSQALEVYKQKNKRYPERVFFYRDGVGDGQLEQVYKTELKSIAAVLKDKNVRLTYIVVNKRIGARFYLSHNRTYVNCKPGTVIDDVVTRQHRYDFYLISQSTRQGTVAPTYYNIIYDESGMDAAKHQAMAFKLCLLYYNWTGTVRVPAPCQYAHKLAYLCGEHLHSVPNSMIEDRLHFL